MGSGESTFQAQTQFESARYYKPSPKDDFRDLRPNELDKFIAEQLQPDETFKSLVFSALDTLCYYLQQNMQYMRPPLSMKRLIKGGSMGKGTALKGKSDLDCILIMNGITDVKNLRSRLGTILSQLQNILQENPLAKDGFGVRILRVNEFMMQIEMTNFKRNESVDVDILPTFDAQVTENPNSRKRFYDLMASYDDYTKEFCSAALVELQRDFLKDRPAKLKDLIRLIKHWCKEYLHLKDGPRMPNSYLIELLTIHVWEGKGSPTLFNTASMFKDVVMASVFYHEQLNVTWNKYYNSSMISFSTPRVVDPANPYNNVYEVVKDWERVKKVARDTLEKRLFNYY